MEEKENFESRRHMDKILIDKIDSFEKKLEKFETSLDDLKNCNNETKMDTQERYNNIDKKLSLLVQTVGDGVTPLVEKHEVVLYGDPKSATRNGLINSVANLKQSIETGKWLWTGVWTAIWGLVIVVIAQVSSYFIKTFSGR